MDTDSAKRACPADGFDNDGVHGAESSAKKPRISEGERGDKRVKKILAAQLTIEGLMQLFNVYARLPDYLGWQYLTHMVLYGLNVHKASEVVLGDRYVVWLPLIDDIRKKFPMLKVVFAFPPLLTITLKTPPPMFFTSLESVLHDVQADGFLLNVESFGDNACTKWLKSMKTLERMPPLWLVKRPDQKLVADVVVTNSFGFVKYKKEVTTHGDFTQMLAKHDCSLEEYEQTKPDKQGVMGIDTCGLRYTVDTNNYVQNFSVVPVREIARLKEVGVMAGQRKRKFKEKTDGDNGNLLVLSGNLEKISYDTVQARNAKLNFADKHMAGVLLGEPTYDLHPLSPDSLLQMAYRKLGTKGLDNTVNRLHAATSKP